MTFRSITVVILFISLLLSSNSLLAQTYFGAIAYSQANRDVGWSYDHSSQSAAENSAYNECRGVTGARDCEVVIWFRNACGALAIAPDGAYGSGWGEDQATAERKALQSCDQYAYGCEVERWVCTAR